MIRPLLVLRPEPGNAATCAAALAAGLEPVAAPLFAIAPRDWAPPPPDSYDALLIGSANALRHGGAGLAALADKPALCVGEATAAAARAAGLEVALVGRGGLQGLLHEAGHRWPRLLRLAGEAHVPLVAPAGVSIATRIVYAAQPLPLPTAIARLATTAALPGLVAALHSAEAARHFAAECDRLALPRQRIACALIGPRLRFALGPGWAAVDTASTPDDAALLALAAQLCNKP